MTTTRIFKTEYDTLHRVLDKEIDELEDELYDLYSKVKDPEYIYMTTETVWKYTDPIEKELKALYGLKQKMTDSYCTLELSSAFKKRVHK